MTRTSATLASTEPLCDGDEAVRSDAADELPLSLEALFTNAPVEESRVDSRHGPSARLATKDGRECIEVRDASSRLVFELDTVTGKATVLAPRGNLSFAALDGDIEFVAKGTVRVRGERVEISGGKELPASIVLGEKLATLSAHGIVLVAERLESAATRIFERARNVYRQVEELHQLRATRVRTVVTEGHHLRAGHIAIEADEEVRIDGTRINLG